MSSEGKNSLLDVEHTTVRSTAVLMVTGEVDVASAPRLQAAVEEALREQPPVLVVDLSGVSFFGSAGLSVLLVATETAPAGGLRVVASDQVRRPIEVTGLDKLLAVFDTVDRAVDAN
ncbi:STAS domain-containing protein [Nocardia arizonensis]|uniref:STAS domain-containing protein n=1 Tax=Nocardia arizonensis TaxID=1141647 RepID=UPI0006D04F6F|nr:STAS domain-containing protein [Nocardia arizonensis]